MTKHIGVLSGLLAAIAAPIVTIALFIVVPMQHSDQITLRCLPGTPYNQAKADTFKACFYKHGGVGFVTLSEGVTVSKTVGGTVVSAMNLRVYR